MVMRRWTKDARLSLARMPAIGKVPTTPTHVARELWQGDPALGVRILRGEFSYGGFSRNLAPGQWEDRDAWPDRFRKWVHGFSWLRDLRALGTDSARLKARSLVSSWISYLPPDSQMQDAALTGERLAAFLGNYDFFAASAGDDFRQSLMGHIMMEGRTIAALLPLPEQGWRGLTALKGLLAVAIALPEQTGFMTRFLRYIDPELERQILPDGCVAMRSPEAQFQAVRELAEMRIMLQTAQLVLPLSVGNAIDRLCPVLRAMRHGDGGLALFNGATEHSASLIDMVLAQASRGRVSAASMPNGGFVRIAMGRSLLIVDGGPPAPRGFDDTAHAGTLSFEFSLARQRLIVNCGASPLSGWESLLRMTAAHSVLTAESRSSSDFDVRGGLSRRPVKVQVDHQTSNGAHWLDMSHDGYRAPLGCDYQRRLYLGDDGGDLRGEEVIEGERPTAFVVRFHLHPSVSLEFDPAEEEIILRAGQGGVWQFRQDGGVLGVEESIYFGGARPGPTRQITITVKPVVSADPIVVHAKPDPAAVSDDPAQPDAAAPVLLLQTDGEAAVIDEPAQAQALAVASAQVEQPQDTIRTDVPVEHHGVAVPESAETAKGSRRQVVRWALVRVDGT